MSRDVAKCCAVVGIPTPYTEIPCLLPMDFGKPSAPLPAKMRSVAVGGGVERVVELIKGPRVLDEGVRFGSDKP